MKWLLPAPKLPCRYAALLLRAIAGHDARDATSVDAPVPDYLASLDRPPERLRIGLVREYFGAGLDPEIEIYWGAYLGTPDQLLLEGTIGAVGSDIEKVRAEARAEHGWIMDTYLLRRP